MYFPYTQVFNYSVYSSAYSRELILSAPGFGVDLHRLWRPSPMPEQPAREVNLQAANARKSADARAKVVTAVSELMAAGQKVSVYAVHRHSGVSRTYIYGNAALRDLIAGAAQDEKTMRSTPSDVRVQARLTAEVEKNEALQRTVDRLRAENADLRRRLGYL